MSNRNPPFWVHKKQRAEALLAASVQPMNRATRRARRTPVYQSKELRRIQKNDPLVMMNRRRPPTRRPAPPMVTQRVPEYMKQNGISPYAPLNGRMPEYLNPMTPVPQSPNPLLRRMPEMDHY